MKDENNKQLRVKVTYIGEDGEAHLFTSVKILHDLKRIWQVLEEANDETVYDINNAIACRDIE